MDMPQPKNPRPRGHEIYNPGAMKFTTQADPSLIIIPVHSPCLLHAREKRIRFQRNNAFSPYSINLHGHATAKESPPQGPWNLQPRQTHNYIPSLFVLCLRVAKKILKKQCTFPIWPTWPCPKIRSPCPVCHKIYNPVRPPSHHHYTWTMHWSREDSSRNTSTLYTLHPKTTSPWGGGGRHKNHDFPSPYPTDTT